MPRKKNPAPAPEVPEEELRPRSRFTLLFRAIVLVAFVVLAVQLYQIQIVRFAEFRRAADTNRFRLLPTDAPRGVIYDRNGRVLVYNEPSFNVSIVPADVPEDKQEEELQRLSQMIDVPVETKIEFDGMDAIGSLQSDVSRAYVSPTRKPGLRELVEEGRRANPYATVLLQTDVPRPIAFALQERSQEYPGVKVGLDPVRKYLDGALTSHLLGYVGHIPRENFDNYASRGYIQTDQVGLTGAEYTYEDFLRGTKGQRHVEVDANGIEISSLGEDQPQPGNNLYLTIDLDLQKAAQQALEKGMKAKNAKQAVAVVMNPNNGQILALVSLPAYDNNLFAVGIKSTQYQALAQDPLRPLLNQAISGQFPPGSTFKLVAATGALQEGVIDDRTALSDPGVIYVPNKYFPDDVKLAQPFVCWLKTGHGALAIREGIAQSCDVFFYKLVGGFSDFTTPLGETLEADYARQFGFGQPLGIDLPGEAGGLVPGPLWKKQTWGELWFTGDSYNMAIGQGFVLATPLQVTQMTAVVANGGYVYRPHVGYAIVNPEQTITQTVGTQLVRKIDVDPKYWQIVRDGMRGAITHGTAWKANLAGVAVAGKTGTAEFYGPRINGHLPTHAWFTAFAPFDKPEVAVTVFVYNGGEGSEVAAPIAADILRAYFHLPSDAPLEQPQSPPPPPETRNPSPGSGTAPSGPAVNPTKYAGRVTGAVNDSNNERPIVQGVVKNISGLPVEGARVMLERIDGPGAFQAVTDSSGAFAFQPIQFNAKWSVRVAGPIDSDQIILNVEPYRRYLLQFNAVQ